MAIRDVYYASCQTERDKLIGVA